MGGYPAPAAYSSNFGGYNNSYPSGGYPSQAAQPQQQQQQHQQHQQPQQQWGAPPPTAAYAPQQSVPAPSMGILSSICEFHVIFLLRFLLLLFYSIYP